MPEQIPLARVPAPIEPFVLTGRHVELVPLAAEHVDALTLVALDPRIWEFSRTLLRTRADVEAYVAKALADRSAGTAFPFATVHRTTGTVVGSTRFENLALDERRVEVGWSWLGPAWWRTAVNTEAKFLMLRHAFEQWQCVRVEFKVLVGNDRSLASITRIGATREGILRRRLAYRDGTFRDVHFLSMLDAEWPAVRSTLEGRLRGAGEAG